MFPNRKSQIANRKSTAFTLIELLVVIGIIALLLGILLPVISKVRLKGHEADTKNFISQLSAAIEQYHSDQRAYPGPLPWNQVYTNSVSGLTAPPIVVSPNTPPSGNYDTTNWNAALITSSENLTLGLLGGLNLSNANPPVVQYDPSQVGLGPMNLNQANPKRFPAYVDTGNLDWTSPSTGKTGHYSDDAAAANDTLIPEFVDRFPDGMPILYLRARVGQPIVLPTAIGYGPTYNSVITDGTLAARSGQYDLSQIIAYTGAYTGTWPSLTLALGTPPSPPTALSIGTSKIVPTYSPTALNGNPYHGLRTVNVAASTNKSGTGYYYPYDAFPYFQNPNTPNTPRQKDGYILISAGADRIYGTSDDICSFGDVLP